MAKLTQISLKEVESIQSLDNDQILNTFRPGTKFRIFGDDDPWYIVKAIDDNIKGGHSCLIIYKSWSKYKQRWVYKVEDVFSLLWTLGYKKEIYKDNEGNLIIKDKK